MKIKTKVFLGYFIAAATALYFLMQWVQNDVRARYLEAVEENMVDMANTLAALAESNLKNNQINIGEFKDIYSNLKKRHFKATIYNITKQTVDSHAYITDKNGIVLFDSAHPDNEGKDFSQWNDVARTLSNNYGARATRTDIDDPASLVLYVAAPIRKNGELLGVITLCKPIRTLVRFIDLAENRIKINAISALILLTILGLITSIWITSPVIKLKKYVEDIRDGKKTTPPKIGKGEIGTLARSFEEMCEALEGKKYVEEYVRNLTHELKSPLSGIQGALELLKEKDVPKKQQEKFLSNMHHESTRMRQIVDRMLLLSQLENINTINIKTKIDMSGLINEIINSLQSTNPKRKFTVTLPNDPVMLSGDKLLIYEGIDNILKNAVEFTAPDGEIKVHLKDSNQSITVTITDNGAGIPEYAKEKVFKKFFSLPRPGKEEKSSGLGLSITKEIVELHNGKITLDSCETRGTTVEMIFTLSKTLCS